jgi:prepilin-type N-terminal cleavage/methylation domain-containing protein
MQSGPSGGRAAGRWWCGVPCGACGYSLIELAVTLSLVAILSAITLPALNANRMNIVTTQRLVLATLRLARANAITKSIHYEVSFPSDQNHVTLSRMVQSPIDGTWSADQTNAQTIALPASTWITASCQPIRVEFNTRGMVVKPTPGPAPVQINLSDAFGLARSLQVWPSGQMNEN